MPSDIRLCRQHVGEGGGWRLFGLMAAVERHTIVEAMSWGRVAGNTVIGIMRLWSLRIYCKQNETPYALIIPTEQRFTAHLLYKTRLSKNL